MILGVDTDILVAWTMAGSPRHEQVVRLLAREVGERGNLLGLTPQVLHELLHVVTDPKRFESSLPMSGALRIARALWEAQEVVPLLPTPEVLPRTLELMADLRLGRKRILDTALAATLEAAGVQHLMTLNPGDFGIFPFLEIVELD